LSACASGLFTALTLITDAAAVCAPKVRGRAE